MNNNRLATTLIWLLIVATTVYLVERFLQLFSFFATPVLLFGLAWLIALLLQPIVVWMIALPLPALGRRANGPAGLVAPVWHMPRSLAVLLVYLLMFTAFVGIIIALVPAVVPQISGVIAAIPEAVATLQRWTGELEQGMARFGFRGDLSAFIQPEPLIQQAGALSQQILGQSLSIAGSIATLLFNTLIVLILSYYITLDGPRLEMQIQNLMPPGLRDETQLFFATVDRTFGAFVRATVIQSLIYGLATAVVMIVLGLRDVALASLLAGLSVLIPLVGGVLALIPPLLIALSQAPDRFLLVLVILLVVQQILFNVVMPRVMGQIIGLHPLLVFAAILIGATAGGGWGILFAVPIAGVVMAILQFIHERATTRATPGAVGPP